jgi:hypothetical protein
MLVTALMPQPETCTRKPSANQVVLDKVKKGVGQPSKSRKKKPTKNQRDDSLVEEPSDDEDQPRKRQKKVQDVEQVSIAVTSLDDELEVVPMSDMNEAKDSQEVDNVETVESADENIPVR